MSAVRDALLEQVTEALLRDLAPHHLRGALFVVRRDLPLLQAAFAVAEDRAAEVAAWLASGALRRFEDADLIAWSQVDVHRMVVVQPYVLVEAPAAVE